MLAWLRAESDNADPAAAANVVNTRMGESRRARQGHQGRRGCHVRILVLPGH